MLRRFSGPKKLIHKSVQFIIYYFITEVSDQITSCSIEKNQARGIPDTRQKLQYFAVSSSFKAATFGRVGASAMIVIIPKKHLASVWDLRKHLAAVFCLEVQTQRKSPHFPQKQTFHFRELVGMVL